ncbi:MAG: hypothetical protein QGI75_03595 [Phycisphaerales bacterium]|jgi:hypothetical protein|nr:hypothetical protein [Phycisphaerales bacterium]MDP6890647.1 hypothetical protein [Phycisphaerales bacterium]
MLGNLNIYSGAEKIDAYSLSLRQFAEGFFGFGGFSGSSGCVPE